jgi:hypothetical protein
VTPWSQPSMFEAGDAPASPAIGGPVLNDPRSDPRTLEVIRGGLFYFDPRTGQSWLEPTFEDLEP